MKDFLGYVWLALLITSAGFLIAMVLILAASSLISGLEYLECKNYSQMVLSQNMEDNYHWSFWTGCKYQVNGALIDADDVMFNTFDGKLYFEESK